MTQENGEHFKGFITPPDENNVTISEEEGKRLQVLTSQKSGYENIAPLLRFAKELKQRHSSATISEVVHAIRSYGVDDPHQRAEIEKNYNDQLTVVTDLHGMDERKSEMLDRISENPGEAVTFIGDVLGSPQLDALQKLFYNSLVNHVKTYIKSHPDASESEILAIKGRNERGEEISMEEGFRRIRFFERSLEGKSEEEIDEELNNMSDEDIADEIRRYSQYVHYGHYASNLSEQAKHALVADVKSNADSLISALLKIKEKGVPIVVMQGNWEAALPIDFVPGIDHAERLPRDQRLFDAKNFFNEHGITYLETLGALETESMMQIFVPFDISVKLGQEHIDQKDQEQLEQDIQNLQKQVMEARRLEKQIVLISHAVPLYDIHNLHGGAPPQNQENKDATRGIQRVIANTIPDVVFYGHMHGKLKDTNGQEVEENTFRIVVLPDGGLDLDRGETPVDGSQVIATYGRMSEEYRLKIPRSKTDRKEKAPYFHKRD